MRSVSFWCASLSGPSTLQSLGIRNNCSERAELSQPKGSLSLRRPRPSRIQISKCRTLRILWWEFAFSVRQKEGAVVPKVCERELSQNKVGGELSKRLGYFREFRNLGINQTPIPDTWTLRGKGQLVNFWSWPSWVSPPTRKRLRTRICPTDSAGSFLFPLDYSSKSIHTDTGRTIHIFSGRLRLEIAVSSKLALLSLSLPFFLTRVQSIWAYQSKQNGSCPLC